MRADRLHRRALLAAAATLAAPVLAAAGPRQTQPRGNGVDAEDEASFQRYIDGVKAEAAQRGISRDVLDAAFAGVHLNRRVIHFDYNQPEVQFTWQQYRSHIVSDNRVAGGRVQNAKHAPLLARVSDAYGVPGPIIVGLWGLESDYGRDVGNFNVIEAVASLAWDGRRGAFFRSELMDCLKILQAGDIRPQQMRGSWAGAMGQTQFMPDSFLRYAVDFDHRGSRDLWNDFSCVFASTANNLAMEGWRAGVPWGGPVDASGVDPALIGRGVKRPARDWARLGVRRTNGTPMPVVDVASSLIQPGSGEGDPDTYLVYATQFASLRAYNPSDKYALCIGLLADRIGA